MEVVSERLEDCAVGVVRFSDGDRNYLSPELLERVAGCYRDLEEQACRAIVLTTESRHFCAGAHFSGDDPGRSRSTRTSSPLYDRVPALFDRAVPVIAVVDGAAIGGGLGFALSADFRFAGPNARFSANFSQIGLSPGFGLTKTLPEAVGAREAAKLFYTGRRIDSLEATRIGLCESASPSREDAFAAALEFAREIASSAPASIRAIYNSMHAGRAEMIRKTLESELLQQQPLYGTADFKEGVLAARERRAPQFEGR